MDAESGGTQVGSTVTVSNVDVDQGLFNVRLQVEPAGFNGQELWLSVRARSSGGTWDPWMTPRQEVLPVPYALSLRPGAVVSGSLTTAGDYGGAILAVLNDAGRGVYSEVSGGGNAGRFIGHGSASALYAESDGSGNGIYAVGSGTAGKYGGQFHGHSGLYTFADTGTGVVVNDSDGIDLTYSQDPGDVVASDDLLADNALGLGAPGRHGGIYVRDNADVTMLAFTASNGLLDVGGTGDDGDLYIVNNTDARTFQVDGQTASFWAYDGTGTAADSRLFEFDGDAAAPAIWGDQTGNLADLVFRSNDDVAVHLEQTNPDGTTGEFVLYDNAGAAVFRVDEDGDVWAAGDLDADQGAKSAIVSSESYGRRKLYAMESPEIWFEDFGTGQLVGGRATVQIEPIFLETINTSEPYHVFVTPLADCSGLYVSQKGADSFEVRELGSGTASVSFDYRIVAKRLGYEEIRLAQPEEPEEEAESLERSARVGATSAEEEPAQSEEEVVGRNPSPVTPLPSPDEDAQD